jgi:hypothetical protein
MLKYTQLDDNRDSTEEQVKKPVVRERISFLWYKAGTIVLEGFI